MFMKMIKAIGWTIGLLLTILSPIVGATGDTERLITKMSRTDKVASLAEATHLSDLGFKQYQESHFEAAIQLWQKALPLYRSINDLIGEGRVLGGIGTSYDALSESSKAIGYQEKRLALGRSINDQRGECHALGHLGEVYESISEYEKAIDYQTKSLAIALKIKDRRAEQKALGNLGINYFSISQYKKAIEYQEKSLVIALEIKDQVGEVKALGNLGVNYFSLSQYDKGIEYQEKSLAIALEIKDRRGEGNALGNLGLNYYALNKYEKAIDYYNRRLIIAREIKDRRGESNAVGNLGLAYYADNQPKKAITYHLRRIALSRSIRDRRGEGQSLGYLGNTYFSLSDYAKSIYYQERSLEIARQIKNRQTEGKSLGYLGNTYFTLGSYAKAIEYQSKSLDIAHEIGDGRGESQSLGYIGLTYHTMGNYSKAIEYHQKRLPITKIIKDRRGESNTFANLGLTYHALGQDGQALQSYEQSLAIARDIKAKRREGSVLGNMGVVYDSLGNHTKALDYHEQSLAIARHLQDKEAEGVALNNMGATLVLQKQPELAIIFYKQSVNVREGIRKDIGKRDRDLQESYTQTIVNTYRTLADLLLGQGRVLEAQQVLELLKTQELRDYTRDTRAGGETKGAPLNAIESPVKPPFDTLIGLGLKLTDCEGQKPRCPERDQLLTQRQSATDEFEQQKERLRSIARQQTAQDPAQLQSNELNVAADIVKAQPKSVLIYPLVLDDKLWLVYGLQAGQSGVVFASKEIPVTRKDLSETVAQFRTLLANPNSDIAKLQQTSRKLYGWLIAPLRSQLDQNQIQTLIFSLDRSTRYMPLAALFDGQQYLTERFTLSTILTAGLTNTTDKLPANPADTPVLGLGLSDAVPGFNALPNVPAELDAIIRTNSDTNGIFKGQKYLNQNFTLSAFKDLIDYRVLHIATHGQFVSEDPEQSFLLLGNGKPLKVSDIRKLNDLGSIHLAVLSACETAKGGQDKEGIEVAGLSYYFLTQNVKSIIASLWLVNDTSTSLLMQQFYQNLATGKLTKAEALRQAQLSFLQSTLTAPDAPARAGVQLTGGNSSPRTSNPSDFRHPYYWAPFVLVGNSL
jgi:CHAT domain-containing protein/tetratricopeptide (TPR) repeat protein